MVAERSNSSNSDLDRIGSSHGIEGSRPHDIGSFFVFDFRFVFGYVNSVDREASGFEFEEALMHARFNLR